MNHKVREIDGRKRWSIAIDFDGVLHSYVSPWVAEDVIPDPPVEGAIDWLNEIAQEFDVVVFTTRGRTPEGRVAVQEWLVAHGIDRVLFENPTRRPYGPIRVTAEKPPALIYLDDRGWRFEGPESFPTADAIHRARPWNKAAS